MIWSQSINLEKFADNAISLTLKSRQLAIVESLIYVIIIFFNAEKLYF
jgi:hypothetical protein